MSTTERPSTLDTLTTHRLLVIFRGFAHDEVLRLATALYADGARAFEVTMNSTGPVEAIRALRAELGADAVVGAGTVLEPEQVDAVAAAGAEFVVSPNLDERVVTRTKDAGLVSVPGAFTPTEVVAARRAGADVVKVFPINVVGAEYLRQLRGPLDDAVLMASGGVDPELAGACAAAGARVLGVGAHLFGARPGEDLDTARLRERTARFRDAGVLG